LASFALRSANVSFSSSDWLASSRGAGGDPRHHFRHLPEDALLDAEARAGHVP